MFGQVQSTLLIPIISFGESSILQLVIYTPKIGIPSSFAHLISQSAPSAFFKCFEIKTTTPSQPFILVCQHTLVLHLIFHSLLQGSLTDISTSS